jgi:hypothetical protein
MVLRWGSARMGKALDLISRLLLARAEWMVECPLLALSGHRRVHCKCLLLTQSGHEQRPA